jgi:transketolase
MPNAGALRPADPVEVADALAYALLYDGKRCVHHADDAMARITAERLIRHLEQAGFVLMRAAPTTSNMPPSIG